jgi:phage major head subunit gpT-like protein
MGVINTGSFTKALWPGINKWFGTAYAEWPEEYTKLFDVESSNKAFEEEVGVMGFGLASMKPEGAGITYDEAAQGFINRYINRTYALGFIITQEAIEDNQYDVTNLGKKKAQALAFSMRQTLEVLGANFYNTAFTTAYGDGQYLIDSDHPNKAGGTYSNKPSVDSDLTEAALEQAVIDIAGFLNDRGLKIALRPKTLIIPKELAFEAERILKSQLQSGGANNDLNALKTMGSIPEVVVNHYLTDTDAWFIRTNCPDGMKMFRRVPTEFGMDNDFDTYNAKYKARFRCSFGNTDPRGIYGCDGV